MQFADRSAIITGAASGIGCAIASRLAAEGVQLSLADLDHDRLCATAKAIGSNAGIAPYLFVGDLSDPSVAQEMINSSIADLGTVDILINNAGGGVIRETLEHSLDTLRATIDRNLWTVLHCTRALLPHLIENRYGRVVSLGAESVRNGLLQHAVYNSAKGGVHGFTTGLAREFATSGLTFNVVAPAFTMTPELNQMLAAAHGAQKTALDEFFRTIVSGIPMGRPATVDEVAAVVAFLASDEASYVTGQTISVNGGSSML